MIYKSIVIQMKKHLIIYLFILKVMSRAMVKQSYRYFSYYYCNCFADWVAVGGVCCPRSVRTGRIYPGNWSTPGTTRSMAAGVWTPSTSTTGPIRTCSESWSESSATTLSSDVWTEFVLKINLFFNTKKNIFITIYNTFDEHLFDTKKTSFGFCFCLWLQFAVVYSFFCWIYFKP